MKSWSPPIYYTKSSGREESERREKLIKYINTGKERNTRSCNPLFVTGHEAKVGSYNFSPLLHITCFVFFFNLPNAANIQGSLPDAVSQTFIPEESKPLAVFPI